MQLKTNAGIFPQTNGQIISLAGSSKIYPASDTSATPISDDTASAIVIGPVLNVRKSAVTQGAIYTKSSGTFKIAIGNATGDGDKSGTTIRADARTAQNIVLIDIPPAGSAFVSATNGGAYDSAKNEVRWNLPGLIASGAKIEVQITCQKTGNPGSCGKLENNTLRATSDGYPFDGNGNRFYIQGEGATIPVVVPVRITNFVLTPNLVFFGNQGKFEVDNFWDQPISGLTLNYTVQSNMSYAGGANPPAASATASQLQWTFDMPKRTKDVPAVNKFSVNLLAGFTREIIDGSGIMTITPPAAVPSDCSSAGVRFPVAPRINVKKYSQESAAPVVTFQVFLENPKAAAFTVALEHQLPTGMTFGTFIGPNGSAPQQSGGKLSWAGIVVPGGTTSAAGQVILTYTALVATTAKLGTAYTNTLVVKSQSPTTPLFDVTRATVVVRVARDLYMPLIDSNAH